QTLVRAHFEMLTAVLVLVWRTDDAVHVLLRRQRHGAHNSRTSASDGVHDLACGTVNHSVVVRLEPDADLLSRHGVVSFYSCFRPSTGSALERLPSVPADHDRPPRSGVSAVPVGEVLTSLRNADGAFTHWLLGPNPLMQIHRSDSVSGCSQYRYRSAGVNAQNATSLSCHIAPNARNFRHLACERYLRPCRACGPQARARPLRDCPSEHETGAAVPKDCGPCSGSSVSQIRR